MLEVADREESLPAKQALDWLAERQITEVTGDWAVRAPAGPRPGGWAVEYENDHYPDVDDPAAGVCAMHRADPERYRQAIERAVEWILGMQSSNGGWGAFDVDNTHDYLNSIPFADHGALLDPPTADVTARCLSMLAQTGHGRIIPPWSGPSPISRRCRSRTDPGSDAGAPTTSTAPGRFWWR
jgi:squalene-hopene/tetraprenyl-beta-curcumene cyclase